MVCVDSDPGTSTAFAPATASEPASCPHEYTSRVQLAAQHSMRPFGQAQIADSSAPHRLRGTVWSEGTRRPPGSNWRLEGPRAAIESMPPCSEPLPFVPPQSAKI